METRPATPARPRGESPGGEIRMSFPPGRRAIPPAYERPRAPRLARRMSPSPSSRSRSGRSLRPGHPSPGLRTGSRKVRAPGNENRGGESRRRDGLFSEAGDSRRGWSGQARSAEYRYNLRLEPSPQGRSPRKIGRGRSFGTIFDVLASFHRGKLSLSHPCPVKNDFFA